MVRANRVHPGDHLAALPTGYSARRWFRCGSTAGCPGSRNEPQWISTGYPTPVAGEGRRSQIEGGVPGAKLYVSLEGARSSDAVSVES